MDPRSNFDALPFPLLKAHADVLADLLEVLLVVFEEIPTPHSLVLLAEKTVYALRLLHLALSVAGVLSQISLQELLKRTNLNSAHRKLANVSRLVSGFNDIRFTLGGECGREELTGRRVQSRSGLQSTPYDSVEVHIVFAGSVYERGKEVDNSSFAVLDKVLLDLFFRLVSQFSGVELLGHPSHRLLMLRKFGALELWVE